MSWWKSQKRTAPEPGRVGTAADTEDHPHVDETTSLLPPPAEEGHAAPQYTRPQRVEHAEAVDYQRPRHYRRLIINGEDPSPYNFKSLRVLRYLTIFFLALTSIWLLLLVVSLFATPPGMSSRGSGFFELIFATLTFLLLLIEVLFYAVPSAFSVAISGALVLLFLVDSILTVALGSLRYDLGWVGVTTVFWTFLMSAWVVLCGRMVESGREMEEERVRGVPETRRTIGEWGGVFVSSILFVGMLAVAMLLTSTLSLKAKDATLPYPGKRIAVDNWKYRLHVYCSDWRNDTKPGSPTILVEGGEMAIQGGLDSIFMEAHQDGIVPRYCYSDRAGLGFSDNAPSPLSAGMAVDALSEALARLGEDGPWVIISAGVGSLYSHIFAARHAERVRSMILLDPIPPTVPHLNKIGSALQGFRYFVRGLISPLGIPNLFSAIFGGVTKESRTFGPASRHTGRFLKAKLQENTVATTFTMNELGAAREVLKTKGLDIVLISSKDMMERSKQWRHGQESMSRGAGGGKVKEWAVIDGGHEVWNGKQGRRVIRTWISRLLDQSSGSDPIPPSKPVYPPDPSDPLHPSKH